MQCVVQSQTTRLLVLLVCPGLASASGSATIFRVRGYKYYCEQSEPKIWGLYPTFVTFWGYNSCKETGQPIGERYQGSLYSRNVQIG